MTSQPDALTDLRRKSVALHSCNTAGLRQHRSCSVGCQPGVDDGGAALPVRQRGLGHVKVAIDIGAKGVVKTLLAQRLQTLGMLLKGGVVHQHLQAAKGLDGLFDSAAAKRGVFHIAGNEQAAATFAFHMDTGLFGIFVLVQVNDGHIRALARKQHRHRPANARVATGDQCGKTLQLAAAPVVRRLEARFELHVRFHPGLAQVLLRHGRLGFVAARARCGRCSRFLFLLLSLVLFFVLVYLQC